MAEGVKVKIKVKIKVKDQGKVTGRSHKVERTDRQCESDRNRGNF